MEVTEEMIYTYAARFMDQRWAGEVHYNTDYEAHDTNYRMALIKSANEMVGDNEIVKALITKEIIAMLSPAEDIPEYESVYINTIPSSELKSLMQDNNDEVLSRDLETSMIPEHENYGEDEDGKEQAEIDNENGEPDNTSILGGAGTPVTDVGVTYYTNQVAPALLLGGTAGR
jgi:hypothetical protein